MDVIDVDIINIDGKKIGALIPADQAYNPTRKDNSHVVKDAGPVLGYVYDYTNSHEIGEIGFVTKWGYIFDTECNNIADVSDAEMDNTRLKDVSGNHIGGIHYLGVYRDINDENNNKVGAVRVTRSGQDRGQDNIIIAGAATLFLLKMKK